MYSSLTEKNVSVKPPSTELFERYPILRSFYDALPPKPYCTDTLGFLLIRPKSIAVRNAYIQVNPITRAYWLVFDLDQSESRYWPDEPHTPLANIQVINPVNNHCHLFYLIDPAVYTLRQARRKPLELAADVDRGLTALLGADPGYGKLIAKNPLHDRWLLWVWHEKAWGLTELIDSIPRKFLEKKKAPPRETIGLGRNCMVFDTARKFAYSEWGRLKFADEGLLFERVHDFALNVNADFNVPMQPQEVKSITRSIWRWTVRHMDAAGSRAWHQAQNVKSVKVRRGRSEERAVEIKVFKEQHPEATVRDIASIFECSVGTVSNALQQ
jgi:hypothetical protein